MFALSMKTGMLIVTLLPLYALAQEIEPENKFVDAASKGKPSVVIEREKSAPANVVRASAIELGEVKFALLFKNTCDERFSTFGSRSEAAYRTWASKKASLIAQIEASTEYQAMLTIHRQQTRKPIDERAREQQTKELQSLCDDLLDLFNAADSIPNPELATPEKTWARYIAAVRAADRQTALACLVSTALDKFRTLLNEASDDELRIIADSIKSFSLTGTDFGDFVEAVAVRRDGRAGLIYLENVRGEWKISEM